MEPIFKRRIVCRRRPEDGGIGEVLTLDCGHEVLMVMPPGTNELEAWCTECVNEFFEGEKT